MKSLIYQDRHDYILNKFILTAKTSDAKKNYRDIDIIKENHRFLWDDKQLLDDNSWEVRLAKRYYSKLFKEYCIADLNRHTENKVALRWRTKDEVVTGKGQFQCGSRKCEQRENLRTWEVNFAYYEQREHKNALVKLRLCPIHSDQLNYTSRKREVKRLKRCNKIKGQTMGKIQEKFPDKIQVASSFQNNKSVEASYKKSENEYIWCRNPYVELEQSSREADFERYLEDLLL